MTLRIPAPMNGSDGPHAHPPATDEGSYGTFVTASGASRSVDPRAAATITVITTPGPINKRYSPGADGKLVKSAAAAISRGTAQSFIVETHDEMAELQREVTGGTDLVTVPGRWHGDDGTPFEILSKAALAEMLGVPEDDCPTGIVEHDGRRVAARLAAGIDPSAWIVLDADNPPGMPPEWAAMDIEQRLAKWEPFAPGISRAMGVGLRASSARVRRAAAPKNDWTHLWLKLDDPSRLPMLHAHCETQMILHGWSFRSPRYSRREWEKVVGYSMRGLFDTSVWHGGRIVFCARPDASAAPGWVVDDAGVGIIEGTTVWDTGFAKLPDAATLAAVRSRAGVDLSMKIGRSGAISTINRGLLTLDTEIEVKGVVKPLRDWIKQ